ncbi:hypothetical protein OE88DRAFT_1726489 [Heliocybe sulcata]|uniref:Uncharacterized protein n=1 Tax=Heliocybe sulcata TaxID=5364 RepID=A0A5C3MYX7_9AGAM|nr:hypothetical protein OE88DRAFT_1726489 [Heliocybe sulcata]
MFQFAFFLLFAARLASSLPSSLPKRSEGSWCDDLGGGAYDLAYNFYLTAVNTTLPNANTTGAPLVLNPQGQNSSGEAIYNVATYHSQPDTMGIWPNFTLDHGTLVANYPTDLTLSPVGVDTEDGGPVVFTADTTNASQIYCGVADTDPEQGGRPLLALYNNLSEFSICHQTDGGNADLLIYNASSENSLYDYNSCYAVLLHLIYDY